MPSGMRSRSTTGGYGGRFSVMRLPCSVEVGDVIYGLVMLSSVLPFSVSLYYAIQLQPRSLFHTTGLGVSTALSPSTWCDAHDATGMPQAEDRFSVCERRARHWLERQRARRGRGIVSYSPEKISCI